jgi:hypothetical protein
MTSALDSDGVGFGSDAVVQTIYVDTGTGQTSILSDLAVADYVVDTNSTRLVVATGNSPLAIVNPASGEILYNGQIRTRPDSPALTSAGSSIAITTINGQDLALVNAAGPGGVGHVLAIVDITDKRDPRALSILVLPGAPFRGTLLVNEGSAYIGDADGTTIVSLTDLARPMVASRYSDVGGRLALLNRAILLGNTGASFRAADPLGGIRASVLARTLYVPPVEPMLQRRLAASGSPAQGPPMAESVDRTVIRAFVLPNAEPTMSGLLTVLENALTHSSQPLLFIGGRAEADLPRSARFIDGSQITALVQVGFADAVETVLRDIPAGTVTIVVDSNNDTIVDETDEVRPAKEPFSFWEADARSFGGTRASVKLTDDFRGLEDLATVRVIPSKPWVGQHLSLRLTGARWSLTEKVGEGIEYLLEPSAGKATAQTQALESGCVIDNGSSIGNCPDKDGLVELPFIGRPSDFLFRCETCSDGSYPARTLQLIYQKEPKSAAIGSNEIIVEELPVHIVPLNRLMTAYTARQDNGSSSPQRLQLAPGWIDVPPAATSLTIILHGFAVSADDAERGFMPAYFKRLYWTKYPMMTSQHGAHTIGIVWPGDATGIISAPYFPDDEFYASRPASTWLMRSPSGGQVPMVIAASISWLTAWEIWL